MMSVLIYILLINIQFVINHTCGSDKLEPSNSFHVFDDTSIQRNANTRFLQYGEYSSIRIHFDFTKLESQTSVSYNTKYFIREVSKSVQLVLQNLIQVRRLNTKLILKECDSRVIISEQIKTTGIDADLIIIPYVEYNLDDNVVAAASACSILYSNNRPIAGYLMYSSKRLNFSKTNWLLYYTNLNLHEITHVLVFSPKLFELFVNSDNSRIPYNQVIKSKIVNGERKILLTTPKVVAMAKRHFQCDDLDGVQLEDQGSLGSVSSHWDSKIMLSDYMMASNYEEMTISEITLALFEDSGWYKVNYFTGGLFRFGKNAGCDFLNNKCIVDRKIKYKDFFCNQTNSPMCLPGRSGKGYCGIHTHTYSLETEYQYFQNSKLAGFLFADYCPIAETMTRSNMAYSSSCFIGATDQYPDQFQESISDISACFISSLVSSQYRVTDLKGRSICYKYNCIFESRTLIITVGSVNIACPEEGGAVGVPGYSGKILCPYFSYLCTSTLSCNNIVDCAMKQIQKSWIEEGEKENIYYNLDETIIIPSGSSPDSVPNITPSSNTPSPPVTPQINSTETDQSSSNFQKLPFLFIYFLIIYVIV